MKNADTKDINVPSRVRLFLLLIETVKDFLSCSIHCLPSEVPVLLKGAQKVFFIMDGGSGHVLNEHNLSIHQEDSRDSQGSECSGARETDGLNYDKKFNVFRQHDTKIKQLEQIDEGHRRNTQYSVKGRAESTKVLQKMSKVSKDHREISMIQTSERMFNEERKMYAHGKNFKEWACWVVRKSVVHMAKSFMSCVAVYNSEVEHSHASHRMVEILSHLEEIGELLLLCFLIRDRPDEMKACGIGAHHNDLRTRALDITAKFDLVHRICTMQSGQTRARKLHLQARLLNKKMVHFKRQFNAWDEQQAIKIFNLMRYVQKIGVLPFKVAPSSGLIRAVKEEKRLSKLNGGSQEEAQDAEESETEAEARGDDQSSKSSWTGTKTESTNSESSWASLQRRELRRAHHNTPFLAGGKVLRHPRSPRTKGARAFLHMELNEIPLVTGAREAPEAGTHMDSPRSAPHPSWDPHIALTKHRTHGDIYHTHGYGVKHPKHHKDHSEHHNHDHGEDTHEEKPLPDAAEGHHHHHHHKHQAKRNRPMSLRECVKNHVVDKEILKKAYLMRKVKIPDSWREKPVKVAHTAEGILKRAQVVHVHEHKAHNAYTVEQHMLKNPKNGRDRKRQLLKSAKEREENVPLQDLNNMAFRHKFATQVAVERARTAVSDRRRLKQKFLTQAREVRCTTALGQTEIYTRKIRPSTAPTGIVATKQGRVVKEASKRLTSDNRPGYKYVREIQHAKTEESAAHRGKRVQRGHLQTVPLSPRRPATARGGKPTAEGGLKGKRTAQRPQTVNGFRNRDDGSGMGGSPKARRAQSVMGRYNSDTADDIIKRARPMSSIAKRHLVSATGNYRQLTETKQPEVKVSGVVSLSTSASAYFNEMNAFEVRLEKKEKVDAVQARLKSWRTKTKAHKRKKRQEELAKKLYKSGDKKEARQAISQNIKADRLRKFTPFSF